MILQVLVVLPILWIAMTALGPPGRWEMAEASLAERIIFRSALGLGILAYLVLALGLVGQLVRPALIGLLIFALIASLPGQRVFLRELTRQARASKPGVVGDGRDAGARRFQWFLAGGIGILTVLMALGCASPPSGIDWDGLSYHLADPKLFLAAGRIFYLPWEHHSNFPFTVEMLFTLGLAMGSVALAKAFHLAMGLLTAAALTTAYARFASAKASSNQRAVDGRRFPSLLPAALFLAAPLVFWEGTVAYVDLGATLYAFLAIYAFTVAMENRREEARETETAESVESEATRLGGASTRLAVPNGATGWLLLSGVLAGFAIGCKTTNGILLILMLVWGAWEAARSSDRSRRAASLLFRFALPAAAIASPWFIKSIAWTGNPVYPFYYGLFGGRNWSADLARTYAIEQAKFGAGHSIRALVLLPWNLTFHPEVFSNGIGQLASIGPFLLAFLPLLIACRPVPRWIKAYLFLALGYIALWAGLTQQIRYLLPLLPILCLAAAFGAARSRIGPLGRMAVRAFVGAAMLLTAIRGYVDVRPMITVALGDEPPQAYLDRTLELSPAIRFVNEDLPKGAKLLLIEETRGYYFDRPYMWGNPGHHTLIPWDSFRTPEQMARWLHMRGFTHLLLNRRWMRANWGSSPWEALIVHAARQGELRPVFERRGVVLFEIRLSEPKLETPNGRG